MVNRRKLVLGGGALVVGGIAATAAGRRQMGSMTEYDAAVASTRSALSSKADVREMVRYATLAASGHNTQPWRFRVDARSVAIFPDLTRRTPAVDPDDHHLFTSLGCAAENLVLAGGAQGRAGELTFDPTGDGAVVFRFGAAASEASVLFDAIPKRQSTRAVYDGRPVSVSDLGALAAAASIPGVDLVLITDQTRIDRVRDLVVSGNTVQLADPAFMRELKSWLRFSARQALETSDGLFTATSGNPVLPAWLGPRMFDLVFEAAAENDKYARHIQSSSGVAVFVGGREDKDHWVRVGRACQRFALQATVLGLKLAFINQPVEVPSLRSELAALLGIPGRRPDIVMRFGYGAALPFSARRPVDAVLG